MSFLALRIPELWTGGHLEDSVRTSPTRTPSTTGVPSPTTSQSTSTRGGPTLHPPLPPSPIMMDRTILLMILSLKIFSKVHPHAHTELLIKVFIKLNLVLKSLLRSSL